VILTTVPSKCPAKIEGSSGENEWAECEFFCVRQLRSVGAGAGSGPERPNLDADHAKEADLSWSRASSEAVTQPETTIRKQASLIEHGAVNLVTKHPQDSPHPRHGVQEVLPTQR
jgi:hypothetical protein